MSRRRQERTPVTHLVLSGTPERAIAPLAEWLKLRKLFINRTRVSDLTPFAKLSLKDLACSDTPVTDLIPLAECVTMEGITLSIKADPSPLRKLPSLKRISTRSGNSHLAQTAEEFWKEFDLQRASGNK